MARPVVDDAVVVRVPFRQRVEHSHELRYAPGVLPRARVVGRIQVGALRLSVLVAEGVRHRASHLALDVRQAVGKQLA